MSIGPILEYWKEKERMLPDESGRRLHFVDVSGGGC